MGHERTSRNVRVMSDLPLKPEIYQRGMHVRLVPVADLGRPGNAAFEARMSVKGHWRKCHRRHLISAYPPLAEI
jgi:hypothetical protein